MECESERSKEERARDIEELRREIDKLRQRLSENARKGKQLSWDTELLVRKTQKLTCTSIVSCTDPKWQDVVDEMEIGAEGICITDVRTVEQIEFIAAFAAKRQLFMTYGQRSFHLEPRGE